MLEFATIPLLIALGILLLSGARILAKVRAKQVIPVTDCIIIGVALAVGASVVYLTMAVVAGLGHSECAKKQADLAGLLAFAVIFAAPLAALLLYRYYQTLVMPSGEQKEEAGKRPDLKKLYVVALVSGSTLAVIIVLLLGRISLWPPLMFALRNDYPAMAELIIDAGLFTNQTDLCGYSPLPFAALTGKTTIAKRMVEQGADINAQEEGGMTALNWALLKHNSDLAAYLVKKGADVNLGLHSPLSQAASAGNWELTRLMVEKGARAGLLSAVISAVRSKNDEMVQFLLNHGGDARIKGPGGEGALMAACRDGHVEVVRFLLGRGVTPFVQNYRGDTPITVATERGHRRIVEMLKANAPNARPQPKVQALVRAIDDRNTTMARNLIDERGVDVNGKDEQLMGMPVLIKALLRRSPEIARLLVEKGADVNARDHLKRTPLMAAADAGNEQMVRLLLEKGADPNARDVNRDRALEYARRSKSVVVARLLGDQQPEVNIKKAADTEGLIQAARRSDLATLRSLLDNGADVNAGNPDGWRALHWACYYGPPATVKFLIDRGADVNLKSVHNLTPLMNACRQGQVQIVRLLLEKGAEVNVQTRKGWSPLMWASEQGNPEIVELLLQKKANVNVRSNAGITPLRAIRGPQRGKVRNLLMKYGAKE